MTAIAVKLVFHEAGQALCEAAHIDRLTASSCASQPDIWEGKTPMHESAPLPRTIGSADLSTDYGGRDINVKFPMDEALNREMRLLNARFDKATRRWIVAVERREELIATLERHMAKVRTVESLMGALTRDPPLDATMYGALRSGTEALFEVGPFLDKQEKTELGAFVEWLGGVITLRGIFEGGPKVLYARVPIEADPITLREGVLEVRRRARGRLANQPVSGTAEAVTRLCDELAKDGCPVPPDTLQRVLTRLFGPVAIERLSDGTGSEGRSWPARRPNT